MRRMLANLSWLCLVLAWRALVKAIPNYNTANAFVDKTDMILIDTFAHSAVRLKGTKADWDDIEPSTGELYSPGVAINLPYRWPIRRAVKTHPWAASISNQSSHRPMSLMTRIIVVSWKLLIWVSKVVVFTICDIISICLQSSWCYILDQAMSVVSALVLNDADNAIEYARDSH